MAYSTRTISIVAASAISVVLIGGAYIISGPSPFGNSVSAESTHDLLVTYAAKDSDNDGLPDWEEALYGTDPNNAHSVDPTISDGQAVASGKVKPKFATATTTTVDAKDIPGVSAGPQTLTDQFSQELFKQYLANRGNTPPTAEQIAGLVEQGVQKLEQSQAMPDAYNAGEVRVVGSGPDAVRAYVIAVEGVLAANPVSETQSEVGYFSDAVNKGDAASLAKVKAIGTAYQKIGQGVIKLPVPKELAAAHLEFANSLIHLSEVILDLSTINTDPLRAMLGLAEYQNTALAFTRSLSDIQVALTAEQVTFASGTSGSSFAEALAQASAAIAPQK